MRRDRCLILVCRTERIVGGSGTTQGVLLKPTKDVTFHQGPYRRQQLLLIACSNLPPRLIEMKRERGRG